LLHYYKMKSPAARPSRPSNKPVVAVDIDDVLSLNAAGFTEFSNARWGTSLKPEDYQEHWGEMWQIDHAETVVRANEFHDSGVMASYLPISDAEQSLRRLSHHFKLVVVTSRREEIDVPTRAWLEQHYANMFEEVHYTNFYRRDSLGFDATKAALCLSIGAQCLIDDQLKHCLGVAEHGVKAILFGDYPWNQAASLPPGVARAINWAEVERILVHG